MKNFQFIFLRLSLYLIAGILCAFYFSLSPQFIFIFISATFLFFIFAYLVSKRQLFPDIWPGVATFVLIFATGLFTGFYSIPENQPDHYIQKEESDEKILFARVSISEELKPSAFSSRYLAKVEELLSDASRLPVKGKLLLNIKEDSLQLQPGNEILIPWKPEEIGPPLNPFQFSYRNYMQNLGVKRQINLQPVHIRLLRGENDNIKAFAWNLREELINSLKKHDFDKDELAIFQALILGQRRDIDDKLYEDYAATGAIHILAISGLHIGILLLLLNSLLRPLERLRYGKYIKPISVIVLLWAFALLVGLSPSVVRAVTMFSFIAIGLQLKRKTSTLNSLFISLFFLLLINPLYIFQVGFQLSYLAVFSIIVFQPFIYGLFSPKFRIPDYFWKIVSVSLAAQIGVLPLSLFYFHQFPGMFLLTNLVVLPVLGFILGLGILVILLAFIDLLPEILAEFLEIVLNLLNTFISKLAEVDSLVFTGIDFSLFQSLSAYLILLGILFIMVRPDFRRLSFLLVGILLFQLASLYNKTKIPEKELVVFHKSRETVIAKKQKRMLYLFSENNTQPSFIDDYLREQKVEEINRKAVPAIFKSSERLHLVIDTGITSYKLENFRPEVIILRNSPKLNMERLIDELHPAQIIADGSNYPSLVNRWRTTCRIKKIPFHYTGEKGAYIFP